MLNQQTKQPIITPSDGLTYTTRRDSRVTETEALRTQLEALVTFWDKMTCQDFYAASKALEVFDQAVDAGKPFAETYPLWDEYQSLDVTAKIAAQRRDAYKAQLLEIESGADCTLIALTVAKYNLDHVSPKNREWAERRMQEELAKAGKS